MASSNFTLKATKVGGTEITDIQKYFSGYDLQARDMPYFLRTANTLKDRNSVLSQFMIIKDDEKSTKVTPQDGPEITYNHPILSIDFGSATYRNP